MAKSYDRPHVVNKPEELPPGFCLSNAICEEMPDGEAIVIYNIEGTWFIGTSTSPDAMDYLSGMSLPAFTYDNEIKMLLSKRFVTWDKPFQSMNPFLCFIFNYVNPYAKRVMPIIAPELYLTGVINLENNTELSNGLLETTAKKIGVARPMWNEINGSASLGQRLMNMRTLAPGLMLRDKNDMRAFIPNPIHNAVKRAKEAGSRIRPTHIANILQACRDKADVTSISAAFDSYSPLLELLWRTREELWQELAVLWNTVHHERDMRKFAEVVWHHPLNYILFMYKNNVISNMKDEIFALKPIKLTRIAKNKWEKEFDSASKLLKFAGGSDGDS